jgi:ribokinase
MAGSKVIVVGSLHYDVLVVAPDRPRKGETVVGSSWQPKCGGKGGNQAVEAALAGAETMMVGAVGDDGFGRDLLANLDRCGVDRRFVAVRSGEPSGMSVAIVDGEGDYGAVVVSGVNLSVRLDGEAVAEIGTGDVVVLQNEIPERVNLVAAAAARSVGATVILNAAPARPLSPDLADLVDILVVNAVEAEMMGSAPVTSLVDAADAAVALSAIVPTVVVTAGGAGAALNGPHGPLLCPAAPVDVRSTHGAGDCFVGVVAARLAAGAEVAEAVRAANAAAGTLVALDEDARARRGQS